MRTVRLRTSETPAHATTAAVVLASYDELAVKRDARALSAEEHAELLQLTDQVEHLEAARAPALVELAQQRRVPLATIMEQLGIPVPAPG